MANSVTHTWVDRVILLGQKGNKVDLCLVSYADFDTIRQEAKQLLPDWVFDDLLKKGNGGSFFYHNCLFIPSPSVADGEPESFTKMADGEGINIPK